jgi:hypothetical protein
MKKFFLILLGNILIAQTFAEEAAKKVSAFAKAPWCHMPCGKIHAIVWSTLLGTIALQIAMLLILPRVKKLKKWQKYTLYGILTVASLATAAYILPPYLKDGFVI